MRKVALIVSLGLAAALVLSEGMPLHAQNPVSDSVQLRNSCRLAAQVIKRGQPANKRGWALQILPMCGATASNVITTRLRQRRGVEGNSPELDELAYLTTIFKDAGVFSTALEIAADRGAGTAARVQAIRIAYFQLNPGTSEPFEAFARDQTFVYGSNPDAPMIVGQPLPSNAAVVAAAVATLIRQDSSAPEPVRLAARWIMRAR